MANGARQPNPGSDEAQAGGCSCPVMDNNRGKWPPYPATEERPEGWWMRMDCPMHGTSYGVEENQTGPV